MGVFPYYRLSGYLYSFRQLDTNDPKRKLDSFIECSRFDDVKNLYMFDKKLRQLALDALERIEIAMRVHIAYELGKYSPTAYLNNRYFDTHFDHAKWVSRHQSVIEREQNNNNVYVQHHRQHYSAIPIWVSCEMWDFGAMSMLFKGMGIKDKDKIAKMYHLKSGKHLQTHLHAFNFIRNVSAHHNRLWNRSIVFKSSLKGLSEKQWRQLSPTKVFVYFCLMKRMLDIICPNSLWGERFTTLLEEFPQVHNKAICLQHMGVTIDPKSWDLWQ